MSWQAGEEMRLYQLFHQAAKNAVDEEDKRSKFKVVRCLLDGMRDGVLDVDDDVLSLAENLDVVEEYLQVCDVVHPERHLLDIMTYPDVLSALSECEEDEEDSREGPVAQGTGGDTTFTMLLTCLNTLMLGYLLAKDVLLVV